MPVPICRTVQEAYEAGRADALGNTAGTAELAAKVAEPRVSSFDLRQCDMSPSFDYLVRHLADPGYVTIVISEKS
jgi:hypothetical protein